MRLPVLLVGLLAPAVLGAQTAPRQDAVLLQQFVTYADIFGGWLVEAFDSIPAARYTYHPMPVQRTIGDIAQHLESANYGLCEEFAASKHPRTAKDSLADTIKAHWPKDTLVARLRASLRYCDDAMEGSAQLNPRTLYRLLGFETDLAEHYSQLSTYMREIGLTPPSALPARRYAEITLPRSELAKFVGSYELAPGSLLIVAPTDGGLTIRATLTGGGAARLRAMNENEFFVTEASAQITFTRDPSGTITGLILHQFNRDRPAKKLP